MSKINFHCDMFNTYIIDVYANPLKKTIVLKENYSQRVCKIQCDKDDKFEVRVGLGLAISKIMNESTKKEKYAFARDCFRYEKNHKLNYKKYSEWCLMEFFNCDLEEIAKIIMELENKGKANFIYEIK